MSRSRRVSVAASAAVFLAGVSVGAAPVAGGSSEAAVGGQAGAAAAEQRPSFGARVEVVRIHAAVLDGDGHPVTDLQAEDFAIVDNGVEYEVAVALTPAEAPIDVALVFDQSDSIRQAAPTVKRDARAFLDALTVDDCAFVLPFQHRVGPGVWGPSVDPSLLRTIDLTSLEGGTSFNDAVMVGLAEVQRWNTPDILASRVVAEYRQPTIEGGVGIDFEPDDALAPAAEPESPGFSTTDLPFRIFPSSLGCGSGRSASEPDRRRALVVLTDGVDTTSAHTFGELLGLVHQADVPVFTVAIGHPGSGPPPRRREARRAASVAEARLRELAETTGGRFIAGSGSETRLREAYDEIVTILRGSYLLGFYPRSADGPREDAGSLHAHRVEVKVRRPDMKVFARSEYSRTPSDTHTARTSLWRGARLTLEGRLDEALLAARQAVLADGELWDAHFLEAAVRWLDGDAVAALPSLRRALWLEPGVVGAHKLAWQVYYELGDDPRAWQEAIRAKVAGGDMTAEIDMLTARGPPPEALDIRLDVPRVFIQGQRGEDPERGIRLINIVRAVSRAVSDSPLLGLVRDPLAADYSLYIDADDVDERRPLLLESRLELYNYVARRLWREDLNVADIESTEQLEAAAKGAVTRLEEWLTEGR